MTQEELAAVFMPHVIEHVQSLRKGQRLVHYTSAEAGCRIISGQEVWLRNSLLMNDFSEIEHGMACLRQAWASPTGNQLQQWLDRVEQGLAGRIVGLFDSHVDGLKAATFMMSLSRHEDDEDQLGRLSMWRAYGGKSGVALVLRPDIFVSTTDKLKVYSSPVRYLSAPDFLAAFDSWANGLIGRYEEICRIDKDLLTGFFFLSLRVFVLCTKHPGFKEEKEWRIFHSPLLDGNSKWLKKENEIIG